MGERGEAREPKRAGEFETIRQVRGANRAAGHHFFDRDTMAFFGSNVESPVYGGRFFVTSEQDPAGTAWDGERRWTVREAKADGSIDTASFFGEFRSRADAHARARQLVEMEEAGTAVELCDDCVYLDANGWDEGNAEWPEGYTGFLPEWDGFVFGPMLLDEELGFVEPSFSWSPCDGCGTMLGGMRHQYVAVPATSVRREPDEDAA